MAITDLLWTCPHCGAEGSLEEQGSETTCRACGTTLRRARGADIELRTPDGSTSTARPATLLDRSPPATVLLKRGRDPIRRAAASLRIAESEGVVRMNGRYLNRYERLGDPVDGILALHEDRVVFRPDDDGAEHAWPFDRLTAVQPSSSTLQLKGRDQPVASIRFAHDSVRLWEELLMAAIQAFYTDRGCGEIAEFQPRIVVR